MRDPVLFRSVVTTIDWCYEKSKFLCFRIIFKDVIFSLIYPYMQYCILVWRSTYPSNLNRIVLLQKRAVRIIGNVAYDAHTDPIFQKLKILTYNQTYRFHLGKFMYLYHRQMLPVNFNSFFQRVSEIHGYSTRNSSLYAVPLCRTNIRQFSVNYQGVKFFNALCQDIRGAPSVSCFRKKLRNYLINLY